MIGIPGIGGVPEPVGGGKPAGPANAAQTSTGAPSSDQVEVSAAAQAAASESGSDIREVQVEEARQRIEEGTYKLVEVVTQVASRLSKFVG